ncbi:MAG: sodium:proton antiporter [Rhodomicrobiaceae bacterium]
MLAADQYGPAAFARWRHIAGKLAYARRLLSKQGRPSAAQSGLPQASQDYRLPAILVGAVFRSTNSYIGNAPDFMAKSVVERNNVRIPDFLHYKGLSPLFRISIFRALTPIFFT